jgi:hypothetical protein
MDPSIFLKSRLCRLSQKVETGSSRHLCQLSKERQLVYGRSPRFLLKSEVLGWPLCAARSHSSTRLLDGRYQSQPYLNSWLGSFFYGTQQSIGLRKERMIFCVKFLF